MSDEKEEDMRQRRRVIPRKLAVDEQACPSCHGSGQAGGRVHPTIKTTCPACNGEGIIKKETMK